MPIALKQYVVRWHRPGGETLWKLAVQAADPGEALARVVGDSLSGWQGRFALGPPEARVWERVGTAERITNASGVEWAAVLLEGPRGALEFTTGEE